MSEESDDEKAAQLLAKYGREFRPSARSLDRYQATDNILATPEPGETWRAAGENRDADRKVTKVETWGFIRVMFVEDVGSMSLEEFHAWARRVSAKPYPELL